MSEDDARERLSTVWRERWPRHCRACGGWGYRVPGSLVDAHDVVEGADTAPPVELCTALAPTQCHRCGGHGLPGDGAPCQYCGWEFDDGC